MFPRCVWEAADQLWVWEVWGGCSPAVGQLCLGYTEQESCRTPVQRSGWSIKQVLILPHRCVCWKQPLAVNVDVQINLSLCCPLSLVGRWLGGVLRLHLPRRYCQPAEPQTARYG